MMIYQLTVVECAPPASSKSAAAKANSASGGGTSGSSRCSIDSVTATIAGDYRRRRGKGGVVGVVGVVLEVKSLLDFFLLDTLGLVAMCICNCTCILIAYSESGFYKSVSVKIGTSACMKKSEKTDRQDFPGSQVEA